MKKRLLCMLVMLSMLILLLPGCGSGEANDSDVSANSTAAETENTGSGGNAVGDAMEDPADGTEQDVTDTSAGLPADSAPEEDAGSEEPFSIRSFGYTANGQESVWQDTISGLNQDLSDDPGVTHWIDFFYDPEDHDSEIDTWQDERGLHIESTAGDVQAVYGEGEKTDVPEDSVDYYADRGLKADALLIYRTSEVNDYAMIFVLDSAETVIAVRYEVSAKS